MKTEDTDRYLVFRIGNESFAAPLLSVREIVEPLTYRPVPNMRSYFLGLANLRGQIVGVLDLGARFGMEPVASTKDGVFLIFEVEGTVMAGLANCVETVAVIPENKIVHDCAMSTKIPEPAFGGIAKSDQGLLPIVNLPDVLKSA